MKRDSYGDDGPSFKRQRHSDDEVAFLIPSKVAGSIIGKGGSNISRLRNEYKASITVPDCPGPERVLSISAGDSESVIDIIKDIMPSLSDPGSKSDLDIRLLIHQSRAGCVIGKAGSKIKELREKTGARLKVFSSPAPQSTERVVQLLGDSHAVADALREVLDLITDVPIKGNVMNYDPHNYDDFYADEYGGFGLGPSGSRGGGGGMGPRGGPPRGGPRGGGPLLPPMGRGPPPRGGGAPSMGRNGPQGGRNYNDFGGHGPRGNFNGPVRNSFGNGGGFNEGFGGSRGGRGAGSGGGGGAGNGGGFNDNDQETTTQVTIPKDLAGAIIGKAGTRIRKIRHESGAGIEIAEPLPGSTDRVITITGTSRRIQLAQYLLQQSVHESNPNLGRGNF